MRTNFSNQLQTVSHMITHAILQAYATFLPSLQKQRRCLVDLVHISTALSLSVTVFKHAPYNRINNTQFHTSQHLFFQNFHHKRNIPFHSTTTPAHTTTILFHDVHLSTYNRMNSGDKRQLSIRTQKERGGDRKERRNVTEEETLLERTRHMQNTDLFLDLLQPQRAKFAIGAQ